MKQKHSGGLGFGGFVSRWDAVFLLKHAAREGT